jgi:hypothetical protein
VIRNSFLIILLLISFNSLGHAKCNFKTGKYINELKDPNNINSIDIKVAKSGKFARNFFKILTSKRDNIPPNLKKRFKGSVIVNYKFGKCEYAAKIRQSGDRKDHVKFVSNGKALRSIDVKLNEGNIIRATRFKLLIPETRNGINEVLSSLILKEAGFIVPETFEVLTEINGTSSKMIFQEAARKELLERNHRREGPIFKGDEALLWSYKDYEKFSLEPLALSTMVNDKWFMKGISSQKISLNAYAKLQSSYLSYAATVNHQLEGTWGVILDPNKNSSKIFTNFQFLLLAMNGAHGLRPHNRKFYYDAFNSQFHPIYYDGDVEFVKLKKKQMGHEITDLVTKMFIKPVESEWIKKIEKIVNSKKIKKDFISRVKISKKEAEIFLDKSIDIYLLNINKLENLIQNMPIITIRDNNTKDDNINSYLEFQKSNNISQKIISDLKIFNNNFIVNYINGNFETVSKAKIANLLAKNSIDGQRTILISSKNLGVVDDKIVKEITHFPGKIITTPGILIEVDKEKKLVSFTQSNNDDWAVIDSANLLEWSVKFYGMKKIYDKKSKTEQRFNHLGLTGCLTIYRSNFNETQINVTGGECEDSLNILNSVGKINSISVKNAFSDALDIDFSNINISKVIISNAGNDCLDLSEGNYEIEFIMLSKCGDKGISIGEQSIFKAVDVKIDLANIGTSSKDSSSAHLHSAIFNQVETCVEVKQKKQEFGGAFLGVNNLLCEGINVIDTNSIFQKNKS